MTKTKLSTNFPKDIIMQYVNKKLQNFRPQLCYITMTYR